MKALWIAALAIAGCAPVADGIPPQGASVEGRWQVVEIARYAIPASDRYWISFENGRLGAWFGCNHIGGSYRRNGGVIEPSGPIASTMMRCGPPAGAFEAEAGAILSQPMSVSWTGRDHLELSNRAGRMKLVRHP